MTSAVGILSGGLDSSLVVKILQNQGVEIHALHFEILFAKKYQKNSEKYDKMRAAALEDGYTLHIVDIVDDYLVDVLKNPKYGYGKNMNPCLDCHIYMLKKAGEFMKKIGADFIFTGEVLGQRPMTQMLEKLILINKVTGLGEYILRPLSAKLLEPTIPEKTGLIDRNKLEGIEGRGRKRQIELAKIFGLKEYPSPAGGCLYTDPGFSYRIKDMMDHDPEFTARDIYFMKFGRHFRLDDCRIIVGRDFAENTALEEANESFWRCSPETVPGPTSIIIQDSCSNKEISKEIIQFSVDLVARYTKNQPVKVIVFSPDGTESIIEGIPVKDEHSEQFRINL